MPFRQVLPSGPMVSCCVGKSSSELGSAQIPEQEQDAQLSLTVSKLTSTSRICARMTLEGSFIVKAQVVEIHPTLS